MQSKDRARGTKGGPGGQRKARVGQGELVAAAALGASEGSRDSASLEALGEKSGSWVGLQMAGSQLRLAVTPASSSTASSAEGLSSQPLPPSRSMASGLCPTGWSVPLCLSSAT